MELAATPDVIAPWGLTDGEIVLVQSDQGLRERCNVDDRRKLDLSAF